MEYFNKYFFLILGEDSEDESADDDDKDEMDMSQ